MKTVQFNAYFDYMINKVMETRDAGQKEYAHDKDNVFGNFERTGRDLDIEPMSVLWIFLKK